MGTLTITAAGFSALPAGAPAQWPANVTWPGGASPNGSKVYTVSDADWISLLTWTASNQYPNATPAAPATPGASGILLAWLGIWINGTIASVKQFFTPPPSAPPSITIT